MDYAVIHKKRVDRKLKVWARTRRIMCKQSRQVACRHTLFSLPPAHSHEQLMLGKMDYANVHKYAWSESLKYDRHVTVETYVIKLRIWQAVMLTPPSHLTES